MLRNRFLQVLSFTVAMAMFLQLSSIASAQSIAIDNGPSELQPGESYEIDLNFNSPDGGIIQLQLLAPNGVPVAGDWNSIDPGAGSESLTIDIPAGATEDLGYRWQAMLYDWNWKNQLAQTYQDNVVVFGSAAIDFASSPPTSVAAGETVTVNVDFNAVEDGFVQVQLVNQNWKKQADDWDTITAGQNSRSFTFTIPANTSATSGYRWQAVVYNDDWKNKAQKIINSITVTSGDNTAWLPPGNWEIQWNDEFDEDLSKWYPFLGYNKEEFEKYTEFPLRWAGGTPDTAWMTSMKQGRHRLFNGELELDATCVNPGTPNSKVEVAYLATGRPISWAPDGSGPVWGGKDGEGLVSAYNTELYIETRVKTHQVKGWSTWFAFWLHSPRRAYNDNPSDGTEFDLIEITKGRKEYLRRSFNVANHWRLEVKDDDDNVIIPAGTESKMFHNTTTPTSHSFVDVTEDAWHNYGVHWKIDPNNLNDPSKTYMKCYVDGQLYYTFTDNLPTDPVDMMMFLTMEFKKDQWDPNQGDGRVEGPSVGTIGNERIMSRAFVDYVRVYEIQN